MPDLATHLRFVEAEVASAAAAPLSSRKARLAAMLIDAFPDRVFAAGPGDGDVLVYRADLATTHAALGLIFALCSQNEDSPRLAIESVAIPVADYAGLSVEDFMVSLYNDHSVQRLRLVQSNGQRHDIHALMAQALTALQTLLP